MAHILYITNGMSSTFNSSLELSRRLTDAGHTVSYASHVDLAHKLAPFGYPFHRFHPVDRHAKHDSERLRSILINPIRLVDWIAARRKLRRLSIEEDAVERTVRSVDPDLLIIDMEMHRAVIATASLEIPTLLAIVWFSIFKSVGLPPMHTRLVPDGMFSRVQAEAAWCKLRVSRFLNGLNLKLGVPAVVDRLNPAKLGTFKYNDLKALARSRNFDLRKNARRYQWLRPLLYTHAPILCFNSRELEFPHEPHPALQYVGPMVLEDRPEAAMDHESTKKWQEFQRRRLSGAGAQRKLIYCSLGTHWSADSDFLGRVIDVFRGRDDWELVLGLGGKASADQFNPVPENILLMDWAPQIDVLKMADCAITHGGITTINECLHFGVPIVVYSTGHVDQDGCAARVQYHRAGVVGDQLSDDSGRIAEMIEQALADPEIRSNMERIGRSFRRHKESGSAVKLIASMIG